jgi:uncharacterized membrane protein YqjE
MSREEAMRVAQLNAEWGVVGGVFAIIVCIVLIIICIQLREYLLILLPVGLILLAIYCIWRARRFAKIYAHERERIHADERG